MPAKEGLSIAVARSQDFLSSEAQGAGLLVLVPPLFPSVTARGKENKSACHGEAWTPGAALALSVQLLPGQACATAAL